jgi:hypothetical protein
MVGNESGPDLRDLKLGWRAVLLFVTGTAIMVALYIAFGPG